MTRMSEPWTGLAEAVEAVRAELQRAKALGAGSAMPFDVGLVELQFTVVLKRAGTGNTGVKVWVLEAGASGSVTHERTHQLKITLQPRRPDGRPEQIGTDPE
jgi:hypothetical protein